MPLQYPKSHENFCCPFFLFDSLNLESLTGKEMLVPFFRWINQNAKVLPELFPVIWFTNENNLACPVLVPSNYLICNFMIHNINFYFTEYKKYTTLHFWVFINAILKPLLLTNATSLVCVVWSKYVVKV